MLKRNLLNLFLLIENVWAIGTWQTVSYTGVSISGRSQMATAYIPATDKFIIFGGTNGASNITIRISFYSYMI